MKRFKIEPRTFYLVGKFAFFTMGLLGLVRILDMWTVMKSYDVFSSLASAIFYFVLSGFFGGLQKEFETKDAEVDDGDIIKMNKALEGLNLTPTKKHGKKK